MRRRAHIPSRAENAAGYSLSRVVTQWLASHDLGDAEIMASKSGFQESRLAAA
jgi:hypothetical protein